MSSLICVLWISLIIIKEDNKMAKSISDLRSSHKSNLESLQKQLEDLSKGKDNSTEDNKYWKATLDKAGNGSAIIRFLPAPKGENAPFVKYWDHAFKGPGGWYIERSLTTLGGKDPVAESNGKLWNATSDDNSPERRTVRERKRRLHYVSNVLVINDPAKPENNGQVFLFKYGIKIFEKVSSLILPPQTGLKPKKPTDPFDFWSGRNFVLDIRKVSGYANFDTCEWDEPSEVIDNGSDSDYDELWSRCHSLQAIVAPDQFKTYEELEARFLRVTGSDGKRAPENAVIPNKPVAPVFTEEDEDDSPSPFASTTDESDEFEFLNQLMSKVDGV
jgi:hypothetical protein